jgi:hypothetical protein
MGQRIWQVLEQYSGLWVTIDKAGSVIDQGVTLGELTERAGEKAHKVTFVYASGLSPK